MPANDAPKIQLRPDAPVFTPSIAVIEDASSKLLPISNTKFGGKSVPNRRRRKQNTPRVNGKKQATCRNDASRQKKQRESNGDRKKKNVHTTKDMPQQVVPEQRGHEHHSRADSALHLPLHKEADFPSLQHRQTRECADGSGSSIFHAGGDISNNWQVSALKRVVLQTPPAAPNEPLMTVQDDFSKLGLEKLSSGRRPTMKPRGKAKAFLPWEDETSIDNQSPSLDASKADLRENNAPIPGEQHNTGAPTRGRRQRNMTKLRDKWWNAIELRRGRRRMFIELREVLSYRIVDPHIDYSSRLADDDTKEDGPNEIVVHEPVEMGIPTFTTEPPVANLPTNGSSTHRNTLDKIIEEANAAALGEYLDIQDLEEIFVILGRLVRSGSPDLLYVVLIHLQCAHTGLSSEKVVRSSNIVQEVAGALILAVRLGGEPCVSAILAGWDNASSLFTIADDNGDGIFHHCCHHEGNLSVLRLLLCHLSGGTKSKHQQLSKALMMRNKFSQTALHISCACGRVDFVEVFLEVCSTALMAKLLAIEDCRSQTPLLAAIDANASDVVVCLIMWRGNRNMVLRKTPQAPGKHGQPCPMVWAAMNANVDMIELLLQFSDPSGNDYRVTESMAALLHSAASDDIKSHGCQLLIQDGGNPFEDVAISDNDSIATAVSLAAKHCGSSVISLVVSTGMRHLRDRQNNRRRDSKLRQQPESFFRALECKENFEKDRAISNALVELLYRGWAEIDDRNTLSLHLASAVSIMMLGGALRGRDLARLQHSIHTRSLKPASLFLEDPKSTSFVTSYSRHMSTKSKVPCAKYFDRSLLASQSGLLRNMDWFQKQLDPRTCPWLLGECRSKLESNEKDWNDDEVTLITTDGESFTVHDSIVSAQSGKLAAAIRFATMQKRSGCPTDAGKRVVAVDMSARNCAWMLQHIYHGSIAAGLSRGKAQICHEILELMIVAEEFICLSLLQECEMRLLHHDPHACFCWSCSRVVPYQAEEGLVADCFYLAASPSRLLDGSTVLDVLARVQHLEGLSLPYTVRQVSRPASWVQCLAPTKLWKPDDSSIWSEYGALSTLKSVVIATILFNFPDVVESEAFHESSEWNEGNDEVSQANVVLLHRTLLLQFCLEELSMTMPPPCSLAVGLKSSSNKTC
jgi:hypothetical protein